MLEHTAGARAAVCHGHLMFVTRRLPSERRLLC